jgi:hypothetical protein
MSNRRRRCPAAAAQRNDLAPRGEADMVVDMKLEVVSLATFGDPDGSTWLPA